MMLVRNGESWRIAARPLYDVSWPEPVRLLSMSERW